MVKLSYSQVTRKYITNENSYKSIKDIYLICVPADQCFYFPVIREPIQGLFGEDQVAIQGDFKHTAPAGNKLYTNTIEFTF